MTVTTLSSGLWGPSLGLTVLILLFFALILAFEVWMFVDVIRNPRIPSERKLLWALGMLFIHPFVAIIYYFTDHRNTY